MNKEAQKQRNKKSELSKIIKQDYQAKMKALEERRTQWEGIEKQREIVEEQRKLKKQLTEREVRDTIIHLH